MKESASMFELFSYGFMQRALVAAILVGIATGLVGPYLVLRRLSLVGDGLAHLAFGGVALGFLIGINPLLSAAVVVILGSLLIRRLIQQNVYGEAAIALILSLGIGTGIVIIGATRGFGTDLFSYLIGTILALSWTNILHLSIVVAIIAGFILVFKRELFLLTFQKDVARLLSRRTTLADYLFSILIALVTLVAVQAVGILLVTALLVIPTLIALLLGKSFRQTTVLAISISALASAIGIISSFWLDVPPSGLIVLLLLAGYLITSFWKKHI